VTQRIHSSFSDCFQKINLLLSVFRTSSLVRHLGYMLISKSRRHVNISNASTLFTRLLLMSLLLWHIILFSILTYEIFYSSISVIFCLSVICLFCRKRLFDGYSLFHIYVIFAIFSLHSPNVLTTLLRVHSTHLVAQAGCRKRHTEGLVLTKAGFCVCFYVSGVCSVLFLCLWLSVPAQSIA